MHGVTTVFGGNCGFTLAPATDEHVDYLARLMARVEGIPLPALQQGLPWDWKSFGDYLQRVEASGTAVNAGFLTGHSALRRVVMGADAVGEAATDDQIDADGAPAARRARRGRDGLLDVAGADAQRRRRQSGAVARGDARRAAAAGRRGAQPSRARSSS